MNLLPFLRTLRDYLFFVCLFLWGMGRVMGDRNGWLALVNALSGWLGLGWQGLGGWALAERHPALGMGYGLGWMAAAVRARPSRDRAEPGAGRPLRILSLNLRNQPRPLQEAARTLLATDADLLLFQEAIPSHAAQLQKDLADYPHHCWVPYPATNMGLGVVSRHPFAVTGLWDRPGLEPFALRITLVVANQPLDVYCVHFISPTHQVRRLGLTRLLRAREAQVRTVMDEVTARSMPAVVAGDWNQTPAADAFQRATALLTDAWAEAGRGPGWSWPAVGPLPLLRLDHLLHTGARRGAPLTATRAELIYDGFGSDHAGLLVEIGKAEIGSVGD
jgi:vancomycin resistance protein VanJ